MNETRSPSIWSLANWPYSGKSSTLSCRGWPSEVGSVGEVSWALARTKGERNAMRVRERHNSRKEPILAEKKVKGRDWVCDGGRKDSSVGWTRVSTWRVAIGPRSQVPLSRVLSRPLDPRTVGDLLCLQNSCNFANAHEVAIHGCGNERLITSIGDCPLVEDNQSLVHAFLIVGFGRWRPSFAIPNQPFLGALPSDETPGPHRSLSDRGKSPSNSGCIHEATPFTVVLLPTMSVLVPSMW